MQVYTNEWARINVYVTVLRIKILLSLNIADHMLKTTLASKKVLCDIKMIIPEIGIILLILQFKKNLILIGTTGSLDLRDSYRPVSLIPVWTQCNHRNRITQYHNGYIRNRFNIVDTVHCNLVKKHYSDRQYCFFRIKILLTPIITDTLSNTILASKQNHSISKW